MKLSNADMFKITLLALDFYANDTELPTFYEELKELNKACAEKPDSFFVEIQVPILPSLIINDKYVSFMQKSYPNCLHIKRCTAKMLVRCAKIPAIVMLREMHHELDLKAAKDWVELMYAQKEEIVRDNYEL